MRIKMVEIKKSWILIGAVILVLFIWSVVGGIISSDIGISCTFGSDGNLCWFWEKNIIGEVGDAIGKILN